ncbi:MAG: glycosyltransferase [Phycisphaerales bacterium]|nr:glycosyltransferase [Phycisphaerales bacterium]
MSDLHVLHFRRLYSLLSETFIADPIEEMHRRGIRTSVLTLVQFKEGRTTTVPVRARIQAPKFVRTGRALRNGLTLTFRVSQPDIMIWKIIRPWLRRQLKDLRPDVIQAHFGPDGCLIAPIAAELGIPLLVTFYGYDVSSLVHQAGPVWRRRYGHMFGYAQAFRAISSHIARRIEEFGADPALIHILPPGVRVGEFTVPDRTGRPDIHCVHVGRLTAKKGPVLLVRAFDRAVQRLGDEHALRLSIVGDGELRDETEQEIRRLGHGDRITMLGAVPHAKIAEIMQSADIYTQHCVTAKDGDMEGLGVVFAEASACGLPIVSTRHNGIPDVVLHGQTGILCEEHDIEATAQAIATLARSPELRAQMGHAGRAHIERNFNLDLCVEREIKLLREIAGMRRHHARTKIIAEPATDGAPAASPTP